MKINRNKHIKNRIDFTFIMPIGEPVSLGYLHWPKIIKSVALTDIDTNIVIVNEADGEVATFSLEDIWLSDLIHGD